MRHVKQGDAPLLHRVVVLDPLAVAWDCRYLRTQAAAAGFSLPSIASACVGPGHWNAGDDAAHWGEQLQAPRARYGAPGCAPP